MENWNFVLIEDNDDVIQQTIIERVVDDKLISLLRDEYNQIKTSKNGQDEGFKIVLQKAITRTVEHILQHNFDLNIRVSNAKYTAIMNTLIKTYIYVYFMKYLQMLKGYVIHNKMSRIVNEVKQENLTENDQIIFKIKEKLLRRKP